MSYSEDLISVIVPVYNVSEYLKQCIDSIINQSYFNLEIILIDDGSTDGSGDICEEYKNQDSRIVLIHQENGGLSAARNSGIDISKGNYITFIDSDDYIDTDYIEYLYKLLADNNADISLCQSRKVYKGKNAGIDDSDWDVFIVHGKDECMHEFLANSFVNTTAWAKLYKRNLFAVTRFPKGKYHEDVFTTYKVIGECSCLAIGTNTKYNYLVRDNSISNKSFEEKHLDSIEGKIKQYEFVKEHYPLCVELAKADIIYSVNFNVMKMIYSGFYNEEILNRLQGLYREYENAFLHGVSSKKAKLFSVCAFINLKMLIKVFGWIKLKKLAKS